MDSGSGNASGSSAESAKTTSNTSGDANNRKGCVCASATNINIRVTPTTGGHFDLSIAKSETIENLKKVISKKLKVPKERICLLHRDRQLRDGTVTENQLMDGSRLTLLPSVETGLLAQRPEQSVMQALESLNDAQVNDFLSGKAPLNLTMRLGDHMMLIQLQLSTVTPSSSRRSAASSSSTSAASTASPDAAPATAAATAPSSHSSSLSQQRSYLASSLSDVISGMAKNLSSSSSSGSASSSHLSSKSPSSLKISTTKRSAPKPVMSVAAQSSTKPSSTSPTSSRVDPMMEFASSFRPGDSLSTTSRFGDVAGGPTSRFGDSQSVAASARFGDLQVPPVKVEASESTQGPSASAAAAASTSVTQSEISKPVASTSAASTSAASTSAAASTSSSQPSILKSLELATKRLEDSNLVTVSPSAVADKSAVAAAGEKPPVAECKCEPAAKPVLDTRALAEASRNLTQTLKQLSSEVLTSRSDPAEDTARARRQGAIIESMHHHGKGVYSGTFSGTLNPALQDRFGRPKRDISTIIHILNDLLCATPQYRRHARQGATITVEAATGAQAQGQQQAQGAAAARGGDEAMEFGEESLLRENQATRGKLEQLRLIMEERRARRRARRDARSAPYTTQWSAKSETAVQQGGGGEPMDTAGGPGGETDLCEMAAPSGPVAA